MKTQSTPPEQVADIDSRYEARAEISFMAGAPVPLFHGTTAERASHGYLPAVALTSSSTSRMFYLGETKSFPTSRHQFLISVFQHLQTAQNRNFN